MGNKQAKIKEKSSDECLKSCMVCGSKRTFPIGIKEHIAIAQCEFCRKQREFKPT